MTEQSAPQARRVWYLDLLRILAAYGIVVLHFAPFPVDHPAVNTIYWRVSMLISLMFRWCVPVFFMISGALFLHPQRKITAAQLYKRSILRIAVCFIVWSSVYALAHCVIMDKGKWTFLNQFFRGHYHMWYVFSILALYMLTPIVRRMTESKKMTEYFLLLGFVFSFLLPRLVSFTLLFDIPIKDVVRSLQSAVSQINPLPGATALYSYVLGYYLHAHASGKKMLRLALPAAAGGYLLTAVLTLWHSAKIGTVSSRFYDPSSLTVLLMASGVFLFFRNAFTDFVPGRKLEKALLEASACSFGVYLMHPFIIERLGIDFPLNLAVLIPGIPLGALAVFLAALCITGILRRIPAAGRYIV